MNLPNLMRHLFLSISFLFILQSTAFSVEPKNDGNLSEIDRLFYTCKIWGFLKYYHPKVGTGVFDWDENLMTILKNSSGVKTDEEFSASMERWLYYMGPPKTCNNCAGASQKEFFPENFDLSWIANNRFSGELKKALSNLERNRFEGNHHYIGQGKSGQFEPTNESPNFDFDWTDKYQRLLPLFRYWNYVEYFFPYKYQTSQPWDEVLKEMIPRFMNVETKLDFHLAMLELVVKVDDSQSTFVTNLIEAMPYYSYLPVQMEIIEDKVAVTRIIDRQKALDEDLQVGDVIGTVNGKSAIELHRAHWKHIPGSNDAMKNRSVSYTLFMGNKESVSITLERDGSTSTREVTVYNYGDLNQTKENQPEEAWNIQSDTSWRKMVTLVMDSIQMSENRVDSLEMNDSTAISMTTDTTWIEKIEWVVDTTRVGYVDLGKLSRGDVDAMMEEMMNTSAIILDVRNRPRGTYKAIANYLMSSEIVFAQYIKPDFTYPGRFVLEGQSSCGDNKSDSSWYLGEVILLVNEVTQSSSEFTCMCLEKAPRVTVIGSQTAGTIGNGTRFPILGRLYSTLTGTGVLYPDGTAIQREGIAVDITVKPTIRGIREGKDEALEKAMEIAFKD